MISPISTFTFFFNDTATTEIYTLSLHDALPISAAHIILARPHELYRCAAQTLGDRRGLARYVRIDHGAPAKADRKSTRLNSSHLVISYAVFCLKKKKLRVTSR